ncbi:MAG: hypothetical protein WDN66_03490 [Candidatus Saccharibacteria bacterium]
MIEVNPQIDWSVYAESVQQEFDADREQGRSTFIENSGSTLPVHKYGAICMLQDVLLVHGDDPEVQLAVEVLKQELEEQGSDPVLSAAFQMAIESTMTHTVKVDLFHNRHNRGRHKNRVKGTDAEEDTSKINIVT